MGDAERISSGDVSRPKGTGNKYLDYLDKEMSIMGILSTFCVAVVALVLDRVGSAEPDKKSLFFSVWKNEANDILIGSFFVALAAGLFYWQRSNLAWFYGQISLSIEGPNAGEWSTAQWYRNADSWATWIPYQLGFTALGMGFAFYGFTLLQTVHPIQIAPLFWVANAIWAIVRIGRALIYQHYLYSDDPLADFRRAVFEPSKKSR